MKGPPKNLKPKAQNKAIQISYQMIKKNPSDKYKKRYRAFSGAFDFKVRPYRKFA